MVKIKLKDGNVREAEAGTTALDFAKSLSNSLAKKVLSVKINGVNSDLMTPLNSDCSIDFMTFDDPEGRWALRHSASHVLAQAVKRIYGEKAVQLAIGPAIDNGFYYDIDMENRELYERMLSGTMYNDLSTELVQRREQVVFLTNDYNSTYGKPKEVREALLRNLLKGIGENVHFEPNFRCEFGFNITIGNNFFANFDCIMLDGNLITIGDNVLLGPRVGLYTANHALDPQERLMGGCYAHPIVIEDNVWVGAGVHIMGGVTVGRNSVIGAGSVVTKSIPENVIAAGVPCKVIREITDEDKTGFLP